MKNLTVSLGLLASVASLHAFQPKPSLNCDRDGGDRQRAHFCEMREQSSPAGGMISVDAAKNGVNIDPFMPWQTFKQMSDVELEALWLYLQTLPARPAGGR